MAAPKFTVIIPARYNSTRLPGKVLADIGGKPMLQHTYQRAAASGAQRVVVATDDARIKEAAEGFAAEVCMTDSAHGSGTERVQEAATLLQLQDSDMVVNVQADEPLLPPAAIAQVAANLAANTEAGIATLCEPILADELGEAPGEAKASGGLHDPDAVKVVMDEAGYALYFSRAPIPWSANYQQKGSVPAASCECFRHIGIYAYRLAVLNSFVSWQPAALEMQERLEQLRALANGVRIHVAVSSSRIPAGVDNPQDLEAVRSIMEATA